MRSWTTLFIAGIGLCACEPSTDSVVHSINATLHRAEANTTEANTTEPNMSEIVLDLHDDGSRLFGVVQPVLPMSDESRVMIVRWLERRDTKSSPWAFDGMRIQDARFIPGSKAAVVITEEGNLVLLPERQSKPVLLDSKVQPPLSLSLDGQFLAAARGEVPDFEIVRYNLKHRMQVDVTQNMAPAWCPVLSEDGSRMVFVSGSTGMPELWEIRSPESKNQETPVRLTDRQIDPVPFPSGPSAPVWIHGTIAFEHHDGVQFMSVDPPRLLRTEPGSLPILIRPIPNRRHQTLLIQDQAGHGVHAVQFERAEHSSEVVR